ncbi:MAG: hypothetical protein AB7F64_08915 [Gammaproteobacteria bacterium]
MILPKPMVFSVDDRVLIEYTDDPFYETDLEHDIFEIYDLYCEEEFSPDKYFLRTLRCDYARGSRIDEGIGFFSDSEAYDFESDRIHQAPYLIRAIYNGEIKTVSCLIELTKNQFISEEKNR